MDKKKSAHSDKGMKGLLVSPQIYDTFTSIISSRNNRKRFIEAAVKPFSGCRILDIGCGTGSILNFLPDDIGEYHGFDMNKSYIEFAQKKWKKRRNCKFFSSIVDETTMKEESYYDIVIACAILHHLTDQEACALLKLAVQVLQPAGVLVTYDNVYIDKQHWFAKWFISKDRGQNIRTVAGYENLLRQYFSSITDSILHDTLKVPYTIYQTRCKK